MLKGKQLYKVAREFVEEEVVPAISESDLDPEREEALIEKSAEIGLGLLIDIAESLHGIKAKIG